MLLYLSSAFIIAYGEYDFNPHFQQSFVMRFARFNGVLDNAQTESVSDIFDNNAIGVIVPH